MTQEVKTLFSATTNSLKGLTCSPAKFLPLLTYTNSLWLIGWMSLVAKQLQIEFGMPSTLTTDYNIEYAVWMKQQYF